MTKEKTNGRQATLNSLHFIITNKQKILPILIHKSQEINDVVCSQHT
jgi:hypothetical protein